MKLSIPAIIFGACAAAVIAAGVVLTLLLWPKDARGELEAAIEELYDEFPDVRDFEANYRKQANASKGWARLEELVEKCLKETGGSIDDYYNRAQRPKWMGTLTQFDYSSWGPEESKPPSDEDIKQALQEAAPWLAKACALVESEVIFFMPPWGFENGERAIAEKTLQRTMAVQAFMTWIGCAARAYAHISLSVDAKQYAFAYLRFTQCLHPGTTLMAAFMQSMLERGALRVILELAEAGVYIDASQIAELQAMRRDFLRDIQSLASGECASTVMSAQNLLNFEHLSEDQKDFLRYGLGDKQPTDADFELTTRIVKSNHRVLHKMRSTHMNWRSVQEVAAFVRSIPAETDTPYPPERMYPLSIAEYVHESDRYWLALELRRLELKYGPLSDQLPRIYNAKKATPGTSTTWDGDTLELRPAVELDVLTRLQGNKVVGDYPADEQRERYDSQAIFLPPLE